MSYTFYRPFQYFFRLYPALHPTTNLHPSFPLLMPWVLLEANYAISQVHYFFENIVIIEGLDSLGLL